MLVLIPLAVLVWIVMIVVVFRDVRAWPQRRRAARSDEGRNGAVDGPVRVVSSRGESE
jgi:hypothetical protein